MLPMEGYTRDRAPHPHCNTGSDFRYALQHNNPISYFVIMRLELIIPIYVVLFLQCRQQKAEECAFYVCHHMQEIMSAKLKNPEVGQYRNNYFLIINLNIYAYYFTLASPGFEHRFRFTRYERDLGCSRGALLVHQDADH